MDGRRTPRFRDVRLTQTSPGYSRLDKATLQLQEDRLRREPALASLCDFWRRSYVLMALEKDKLIQSWSQCYCELLNRYTMFVMQYPVATVDQETVFCADESSGFYHGDNYTHSNANVTDGFHPENGGSLMEAIAPFWPPEADAVIEVPTGSV